MSSNCTLSNKIYKSTVKNSVSTSADMLRSEINKYMKKNNFTFEQFWNQLNITSPNMKKQTKLFIDRKVVILPIIVLKELSNLLDIDIRKMLYICSDTMTLTQDIMIHVVQHPRTYTGSISKEDYYKIYSGQVKESPIYALLQTCNCDSLLTLICTYFNLPIAEENTDPNTYTISTNSVPEVPDVTLEDSHVSTN